MHVSLTEKTLSRFQRTYDALSREGMRLESRMLNPGPNDTAEGFIRELQTLQGKYLSLREHGEANGITQHVPAVTDLIGVLQDRIDYLRNRED
jgi:hypothetical protein